jgi:AraC family transcriptional regulator of adaptative response/methylated-DNA-[protein]-cysteine methyltransferase
MQAQSRTAIHPEAAWSRVLARDASADGEFVYAVQTTGVFCRPSCPSRRPALRNVCFYPDAQSAIAAGYRACRRCAPAGMHAEAAAVAALCSHIDANLGRIVSLRELGKQAGMSPFTVQRMFERVLGVTPRHYQIERRGQRLRQSLPAEQTVTGALYGAGYSSSSRLYEHAASILGMAPRVYRKGAPGERIAYAVVPCPLGFVLIAVTERGVCDVSLGDDPGALAAELRGRFSRASVAAAGPGESALLARARDCVLQALTEHPAALDLPLDLRATAFEQRVWQALRAIPPGETRSYSQVAAAIGSPKAVRAVAGACSRNPVAILVPCHRVIGREGALTGYRWGLERKRLLLIHEGADPPA